MNSLVSFQMKLVACTNGNWGVALAENPADLGVAVDLLVTGEVL